MSEELSITLDGRRCTAAPGESVLDLARREGAEVPALCHDPRLEPAGACRSCLVEIGGQRRLQPACATAVRQDMVVVTDSERVRRHRQVLMSLYLADLPRRPAPDTAFGRALAAAGPTLPLQPTETPRAGRGDDPNPYVGFDADACILCARCTRFCDEIEGVSAISLVERGAHTSVGTAGGLGLLDTSCELCGGCIDTCPTGAMFDIKAAAKPPAERRVRTTCNFCGVGCQLDLHVAGERVVGVSPAPPGETVNDGSLCVKGRFATDFIHHEDRLTQPLVRGGDGRLHPATWPEALRRAAEGLLGVRDRHGADALGFISSSRCTGEENYLVQKLARAVFGTNNCHQCAAT